MMVLENVASSMTNIGMSKLDMYRASTVLYVGQP